jgi:hypothetical protein
VRVDSGDRCDVTCACTLETLMDRQIDPGRAGRTCAGVWSRWASM